MPRKLFNIPSPTSLWVANKPICDTTATLRHLNREEILNEFHIKYCEDIVAEENIEVHAPSRHNFSNNVSILDLRASDRLHHPLNDTLVVCHIDNDVGHGVFTRTAIPCGTVIAIYTGQVTCGQITAVDYPPQLLASPNLLASLLKQFNQADYNSGIDHVNATFTGGVARFINHMPTHFKQRSQAIKAADHNTLNLIAASYGFENILDEDKDTQKALQTALASTMKFMLNPQVEKLLNEHPQLASANAQMINFPYKGFMLEMLMASRHIAANEQIGWDYELAYWQQPNRQSQQRFFDKDTGKVSLLQLSPTVAPVVGKATAVGSLNVNLELPVLSPSISNNNVKSQSSENI